MKKPPIIDKDGTVHDKCGAPECCGNCARIGTMLALKGLFIRVNTLVFDEIALIDKLVIAILTFEFFVGLRAVCLFVNLPMSLLPESFLAV